MINFNFIWAQKINDSTYVNFTNQKIVIDGIDNESDWKIAEIKSNFWQWFPTDSLKALNQTEIRFLYDSNNIYVFIKCYEDENNTIISSLRRDMGRFSDFFLFTLDTFNDLTNAYAFGGNSVGVKKDEIIFNGGRTLGKDSNWDWDAKFDLKTKVYENFYTAEMRIPLSSIRFSNNSKLWKYNVYRRRINDNEFSTLFRVPQEQSFINLSYSKPLVFEKPLGKSKTPITIIPYINLSFLVSTPITLLSSSIRFVTGFSYSISPPRDKNEFNSCSNNPTPSFSDASVSPPQKIYLLSFLKLCLSKIGSNLILCDDNQQTVS